MTFRLLNPGHKTLPTQHLHRSSHRLHRRVNVFARVAHSQRKTDRLAFGGFGVHGGDDVGGVFGVGETGGAGGSADAFAVEEKKQCFGLDVREGNVAGVGEARRMLAVDLGCGDGAGKNGFESVAERAGGGVVAR